MTNADLQKLIEDEFLDLDLVFDGAEWETIQYTLRRKCGNLDVAYVIQQAKKYGITAYRWGENINDTFYDYGHPTLSLTLAVRSVLERADEMEAGL